ncbi:MAG: DUF3105 domain-containing protein [Thermomicrobiales bacterium]
MAKKSRANAQSNAAAHSETGKGSTAKAVPQQTRAERAARRPEAVKQRKDQRYKAYEKQKRQALYTKIGFGVLAVLVVLGASWWGYGQWRQAKVSDDVQSYFGAGDFAGLHKDGEILYEEIPPVGGPHNAVWQNCGYYNQYINNVNGVHALEHGSVWITYDPKLPPDQIQTLKDLTKQTHILVSPYPDLPSPVVASVWGKQIKLSGADDWRLDAFIKKYRQNPDNTPERGALCTLGTSATTANPPQTIPYARTAGTDPVGGVTTAEATATAAALLPATPTATPEAAKPGSPAPAVVGPIASPAASPFASPVATPLGTPVATPTPK